MNVPAIVIVGAGPGVSASVARRFAREGFAVGLLGNEPTVVHALADELRAEGASTQTEIAEILDTSAASRAIVSLGEFFGRIDVLHFNPSAFRQKNPLTLTVPELLEDVAVGVGGLLTAVQAARAYMSSGARVTVTGSMAADSPWSEAASLGVQKAGVRNLVYCLDATLRPSGIRATSVTVQGSLATEGPFAPDRVADAIWAAAHQDDAEWQAETPYTGL